MLALLLPPRSRVGFSSAQLAQLAGVASCVDARASVASRVVALLICGALLPMMLPIRRYPKGHPLQRGVAELHTSPRVCIKGPEDLGYTPLDAPFEFFELRSAGVDTRRSDFFEAMRGGRYEAATRRRVRSQLAECRRQAAQRPQ